MVSECGGCAPECFGRLQDCGWCCIGMPSLLGNCRYGGTSRSLADKEAGFYGDQYPSPEAIAAFRPDYLFSATQEGGRHCCRMSSFTYQRTAGVTLGLERSKHGFRVFNISMPFTCASTGGSMMVRGPGAWVVW
jgi:hypothetical protein